MSGITILLATYNGESYLQEQLESLMKQSYQSWTLMIHDDNSTDNTITIIQEYKKRYPDKITFIDDTISFGSASANFNFLLEQCQADYIMFCDQDDIWLPHKIEVTLQKMKQLGNIHGHVKPLMVFSDLTIVDKNLNTLSESMWKNQNLDPDIIYTLYSILALNVVTGCTVMLNKKATELVSPMPKSDIVHDHWIAVNMTKYGYASYVKEPLILYRQHSNNVLGSQSSGLPYFIKKTKHILQNIKSFQAKYSYFDFPFSLTKVIVRKITLNTQRLFK
jgi:glycosyltransferase involved in cell wall biosynthesis